MAVLHVVPISILLQGDGVSDTFTFFLGDVYQIATGSSVAFGNAGTIPTSIAVTSPPVPVSLATIDANGNITIVTMTPIPAGTILNFVLNLEYPSGLIGSYPSATPITGTVITTPVAANNVMLTGSLVTTSAAANQVVLTYTVSAGKSFYLQYLRVKANLAALNALPGQSNSVQLGTISMRSPAGTALFTLPLIGPMTNADGVDFNQAVAIPAGIVIEVVVTPVAASGIAWCANLGGQER